MLSREQHGALLREGFWLAHIHWVWEARLRGEQWIPAETDEAPEWARAPIEAEIASIGANYGWERAPSLWRRPNK